MSAAKSDYSERRKHPRYIIDQGSFAIFRQNSSVLPGLIVDISESGLAFFYLEGEDWPAEMDEKYNLFGDDFHVDDILVKMAEDFEVAEESHPLCTMLASRRSRPVKVRRRGLQFRELSTEQQEKLAAFIIKFQDALHA